MEREGWDALKPHEMVELALYPAVPRQDLTDIARLLVDRFGSVGGVFGASREQLMAVGGMTGTAGGVDLGSDRRADARLLRHPCRERPAPVLLPGGAGVFEAPPGGRGGAGSVGALCRFRLQPDYLQRLRLPRRLLERDRGPAHDGGGHQQRRALCLSGAVRRRRPAALPEGDLARLEAVAATLRAADIDLVDCVLCDGREVASLRLVGRLDPDPKDAGGHALFERYARQT